MTERAPQNRQDGPVHEFFSLTYANYLVLPRTLLQSMPIEWQERFTAVINEYENEVVKAGIDLPPYRVHPYDQSTGRYVSEGLPHYRHAPVMLAKEEDNG